MLQKPEIMNEVLIYKNPKGEIIDLKTNGFDLVLSDTLGFINWLSDLPNMTAIHSVFDDQLKKVFAFS